MNFFRIQSLQQRFVVSMLLPVAFLLLVMGAAGFLFSINTLLGQWEEAAVLKLQRTAHHVDMRLKQSKEWIQVYRSVSDGHASMRLRQEVLERLRETQGVLDVTIRFYSNQGQSLLQTPRGSESEKDAFIADHPMAGRMQMGSGDAEIVSAPVYDDVNENETVSLIAHISDAAGNPFGELRVKLDFQYLIKDLPYTSWWRSREFYLVDGNGKILAGKKETGRTRIGGNGDPLEDQTLAMLRTSSSGTVRGNGHPPERVAGYFRLMEAPWYFVVFAPGREILEPLTNFSLYYIASLAVFILGILVLIRRASGKAAVSIREISLAAERIAKGRFGKALPVTSEDEIGDLTRNFNCMVTQLQERMSMKQELDLAKEVQQQLLPQKDPVLDGLDIAGGSRYCDETGGDLYDYLFHAQNGRVHLIVGDVAGHGIQSALLMSTTRASLRQRFDKPGDLGAIVSDVNRQIAHDVGDTGRFVTLFHLTVEPSRREVRWVRAGHDPAILLHRETGAYETLDGSGLALGVDAEFVYREYRKTDIAPGDILLIGTDGLWEARNAEGEMFGKQRLLDCIRMYGEETAARMIARIFRQIDIFTGGEDQADDMTLIVVRFQK